MLSAAGLTSLNSEKITLFLKKSRLVLIAKECLYILLPKMGKKSSFLKVRSTTQQKEIIYIYLISIGASELVLDSCTQYLSYAKGVIPLTAELKKEVLSGIESNMQWKIIYYISLIRYGNEPTPYSCCCFQVRR